MILEDETVRAKKAEEKAAAAAAAAEDSRASSSIAAVREEVDKLEALVRTPVTLTVRNL